MVYFTEIRKTPHYINEHESEVPWSEVISVIFSSSKNLRKKFGKYEIENSRHYLLREIKGNVLYVINAKRRH